MANEALRIALIQIGSKLQQELKKELDSQGHVATRKLRDTIAMKVIMDGNKGVLEESHMFYGQFVNSGRPAGKKAVPVMALKEWVEVKGIATGKKALSIAFAIQKTIVKEGIPTKGSRAMGKKTGWLDDTLDRNAKQIADIVGTAIGKDIDVLIDDFAKKAQQLLITQ